MSRTKSRMTLTPGAQFNIYRNSIGTDFTRAVLRELLLGISAHNKTSQWTAGVIDSLLSSKHCGPEGQDPVDFLELHSYDDRQTMQKMADRITEAFETWTHDLVRKNGLATAYRHAAVNAATLARRVTELFPDITCNHSVAAALEVVIMFLMIEHSQDEALAQVQAATVFGMSVFATTTAQHRGELPNGVPSSPLLGG